jgi:2-polyprenyl-3-methyl-5-hydroxy-6-metoxy-1,4-benzoquinol methylase
MSSTFLPVKSVEQQHLTIEAYLRQRTDRGKIAILEAGCGRKWYFELEAEKYTLTGMDADQSALEARQREQNDLSIAIVGDLREVDFDSGSYDVIYNSFVLEHIDGAENVLAKFAAWLKPEGLLILLIPDPKSAYGFLASLTPHWVHVLFYRYVLGRKSAGKPGFAPYPTFYNEVVSRDGIRRFAKDHKLKILEEFGFYRPGGLANVAMDVVSALTLGRLKADHCNLVYVLEKSP